METITLNNGMVMPKIGFGVYQIAPKDCVRCVMDALDAGYRLLDTAQSYDNEYEVGEAMRRSSVRREDIFLTTKIWLANSGYERAKQSIDDSLRRLGTDYVDLMLIHQPFGDYYAHTVPWRRPAVRGSSAPSACPISLRTGSSTYATMWISGPR